MSVLILLLLSPTGLRAGFLPLHRWCMVHMLWKYSGNICFEKGAKILTQPTFWRSVKFTWGSEHAFNDYKATNGSNSLLIFIFSTSNELSGIMLGAGYTTLKVFGVGGSVAWVLWSWTAWVWILDLPFIGCVALGKLFILYFTFFISNMGVILVPTSKAYEYERNFYMQSL